MCNDGGSRLLDLVGRVGRVGRVGCGDGVVG